MTKIRVFIVVNFIILVVQATKDDVQAQNSSEVQNDDSLSSYPFGVPIPSYSYYYPSVSVQKPLTISQSPWTRPIATSKRQYSKTGGRLLTPAEGCGKTEVTNLKIVGGVNAKIGAYPWMALIGYGSIYGRHSFNCGGSLITSRHILTAAHCIMDGLTPSFVRLGEHDTTTNSDGPHQDIKVVKIDKHERYSRQEMSNDIAILTLERDVQFSNRIRPVCLPKDEPLRSRSFVGTNPFVAGWGNMKEQTGTRAKILQQVQVPVLPISVCQRSYAKYGTFKITNSNICAGHMRGGQDSCQGDSGGPLMLPVYNNGTFPINQIGIVSYGVGCARVNTPGVYTSVQSYIDWIQSKLVQ